MEAEAEPDHFAEYLWQEDEIAAIAYEQLLFQGVKHFMATQIIRNQFLGESDGTPS